MTEDTIDDDDHALVRNYRLAVAWSQGAFASLEGILFDFRSDLDTSVWRPLSLFDAFVHADDPDAPGLVYPWSPQTRRDHAEIGQPLIRVGPGDTVRIGRIETQPLLSRLGELDALENRVRKLVWLLVTRPGGAVVEAARPLSLFAETGAALQIRLKNYAAVHRGLVARLGEALGVEDLDDLVDRPVEEWLPADRQVPAAYADALDALIQANETMDEGALVAFGYMMARAEAEAHLLGAAERGVRAANIQATAAEARRRTSHAATEPLRSAARIVIAAEPDISLSACARKVEAMLAEDPSWTFKSDAKWIANRLRDELFELRENGREYRPRRQGTI